MEFLASLPLQQRTTRQFFIASEDTYAVKTYFEHLQYQNFISDIEFRSQLRSVRIVVLPTTDGNAQVQYLPKRLKEIEDQLAPNDEVWVACDVDDQPEKIIEELNKAPQVKGITIRFAVTNPCFELWLLLHHQAEAKPGKCGNIQEQLNEATASTYRKKPDRGSSGNYWQGPFKQIAQAQVQLAIAHAQQLPGSAQQPLPACPGTHFHHLMLAITERLS